MNFRILHYDALDSTSDLALTFAREGANEGTVVTSDFQMKGRGRFDRKWSSPRNKGLLFSLILRPQMKPLQVPILTHLAAQSISEMLSARFHLPAKLKKPNDVLINGKKICGILTESSTLRQKLEYVVVGVGLNVNSETKELMDSATSIRVEIKKKVEQDPLLLDILDRFNQKYMGIVES